jgi:hypothetical protein
MAESQNQESFQMGASPFDALRHVEGEREFWLTRELAKILGYSLWQNFEKVIAKAKIACKYNGYEVDDQFIESNRLIRHAKGGQRAIRDVQLSRWMGAEELADNIFRAAQTDAALKREQVRGKEKANTTHFTVGRKVREFIINELGGTAPEALPIV